MASNKENKNKMKGLFKGLRYISQIFDDNKKDQEIQIGFPTDVKHVSHIGWDGPSTASSPSWMNEFQTPPGYASSPVLGPNAEAKEDKGVKWVSEDKGQKGSRSAKSPAYDSPHVPKSSRRQSSNGNSEGGGGEGTDSPRKGKSDKDKPRRKSSKKQTLEASDSSNRGARQQAKEGSESQQDLPDIPKKSRRKKSKDGTSGSSSRKLKDASSTARSNGNELTQNPFQDAADKGFT